MSDNNDEEYVGFWGWLATLLNMLDNAIEKVEEKTEELKEKHNNES